MRLTQLIKRLDNYEIINGLDDFEVRGIACNSKKTGEDFIFVAIKGVNADGNQFIDEAISNGAKVVVVENSFFGFDNLRNNSSKGAVITVGDSRKALACLSAEFFGDPSKRIKAIGITGTNGKTTISYLIEALLKEAGKTPAVLGTINYRFKDKVIPSKNTTPGPLELQSILSDMSCEGVDHAIMEVSSHALHQNRTEGIKFHTAIFTNLTQDHLDYHHTIDEYFQSKLKLFKNLSEDSRAILNIDDAFGRLIKGLTWAKVFSYGIENKADVWAKEISSGISQNEFTLVALDKEVRLKSRLIGMHNIYNILAAVSFALAEGMDLAVIKSAIEKFSCVPGRLERINSAKGFSVFVDYAHTEDALNNVIKSLRQACANRIIVVFGCGGERDKTKRPKMGAVVSQLADYAVITSDNPRSEDPMEIISDIKAGIKGDNYCVISNRREAIEKALSLVKTGDILLIAGKGHENYQITKDKILEFDDREVVRECLKSMR